MNKKEKKIDVEAKIFMALLHLKEEKNKKYSIEECEINIVYLFDNYDEFKSYFELNGFTDINKDLIELCRMKTTKKGTIIALKGLCDHAIRKHNLTYPHTINSSSEEKQKFDVLAIPCRRHFVVAAEKTEEFKKQTTSHEDRAFVRELAEKFRVNNLVEEEPGLKKTRKPNR